MNQTQQQATHASLQHADSAMPSATEAIPPSPPPLNGTEPSMTVDPMQIVVTRPDAGQPPMISQHMDEPYYNAHMSPPPLPDLPSATASFAAMPPPPIPYPDPTPSLMHADSSHFPPATSASPSPSSLTPSSDGLSLPALPTAIPPPSKKSPSASTKKKKKTTAETPTEFNPDGTPKLTQKKTTKKKTKKEPELNPDGTPKPPAPKKKRSAPKPKFQLDESGNPILDEQGNPIPVPPKPKRKSTKKKQPSAGDALPPLDPNMPPPLDDNGNPLPVPSPAPTPSRKRKKASTSTPATPQFGPNGEPLTPAAVPGSGSGESPAVGSGGKKRQRARKKVPAADADAAMIQVDVPVQPAAPPVSSIGRAKGPLHADVTALLSVLTGDSSPLPETVCALEEIVGDFLAGLVESMASIQGLSISKESLAALAMAQSQPADATLPPAAASHLVQPLRLEHLLFSVRSYPKYVDRVKAVWKVYVKAMERKKALATATATTAVSSEGV